MAKHRRSGGGGGGGNKGMAMLSFFGTIIAGIVILVNLIVFGIALSSLDTAITTAGTYTEQVGVGQVLGSMGMVVFVVFMVAGIAVLSGAAFVATKKAMSGGLTDILMGAISGGISIVVAFIIYGLTQSQLHTAYLAANATVNKTQLAGLVTIIPIFGIVLAVLFVSAGIAPLVGAGVGGYKAVKSGGLM